MARYGLYNPTQPENPSTMFVFQEVPLTSDKLNRWNGNLAAQCTLLHTVLAMLGARNQPAILTAGDEGALHVSAQAVPDRTVQVAPGWAILPGSLAGLDTGQTVPLGGEIEPPLAEDRIDCVVLTAAGEVRIVPGEEAILPQPPTVPADTIPLALIYLRVGTSQIFDSDQGTEGYVLDARPRVLLGEAHCHAADCQPPELPDGMRTVFSTQLIYRPGTLDVYLNGVLQEAGVDYDESLDGASYTIYIPPPATYRVQHRYIVAHE